MPALTVNRPAAPVEPLAVGRRDAARLLGLSERTVWSLTYPRGPLPVARVGQRRLYPVAALREWLAREAAAPVR